MRRRILLSFTASLFIFTNVTPAQAGSLPAFTALSAEADPHTGSANFAVPIEVPPGRGGVQPNIQLQYNSSSPNDILGVGWNLELGVVQRSSRSGVPRYDDTDTFVLIQNGGVQELVLDAITGLYRGKVEGSFMKVERTAGSWKVTDKSGIQYFFGETAAAREYDPADGGRIFKWCLNRVQDARGNEMTVGYFRDENMLYPQDIDYTGNPARGLPAFARVTFERELRPENEIDRYNTGFRAATRYRIGKISVKVDGNLQRRYDLIYDDSRTTGRSLLTSIAQYGSDGSSSLPPVTFSYQTPKNPDFNYAVTPMNNSVTGDNLWNYRSAGSYDRGSINYGPVPPGGFDVSWGPTYAQSSGGNWSTNSRGSLTFSAGQDSAHWFWTYLYIDGSTPKTLTVPYTTEGVDGVWIKQNYSTSVHNSWTLQPGYNLVEMTFYNQNQGFSFNLNYNLADNVDLMSSGTVILPQLSGDFNADGRTDVATFTAASGKVEVERSNGTAFAPKVTWAGGFATNGKLVLGDFNGDGRMDIGGFDPANGNWRVGLSDGSRFNDAGVWLSGFGANEEPSSGDFNGDGLADILTFYKASGNLYVRIALNKGGNFAALSGGQNILIGSDSDVPVVGDFNGDGQIDFGAFNKSGGNWTIRLNTGDILAGLRQLPVVSGFGAGRNTVVSDFNYDGLTDIGYYDDATGKVVYRVSKGLSFAAAAQLPFVFNIKGPNTQIQSGDYNGDTLIDFAVYNLIGKLEIAFSNGVMPDILSSVANGIGGESSIVYNAAVNYPQTFLPFPIQVVKSITQSNGLGESYTINNSYEQGLWDAPKREFRGFGLVRATDPNGNYSDTFFAQDGIYKGRVIEQRTYDALGKLYGKTLNTWARQEIIPGSDFIYLQRKDNFVYDGDATGRRSAEEFFFGETPQLGNLTEAVQLGEVDLSTGNDIGNDTRSVETAYVQNTSGGSWIAGLPRLTTVKDNAGNIVRQAWFYYDNQGNTTAPLKGILTKKEDWAGGGTEVNPVTQYSYDAVGNLLTTTDPKGNITRVSYDPAYQMFPLTTENVLGHKVINEYYGVNGVPLSGGGFNGLWGQLKSTTDPNNQNGKRVYDVFGRAAAAISPLDSLAFPTQTTAIEFLGSYTKVTTRQRVEHGKAATVDTVSFIDGFGRLAQTKARSEVTGRYVINGQTQYDSRGLKSRQYLPAFTTNPMDVIDLIDTSKPHTLITYDAMGRPVKTTNPDGTFASVSYDDWSATGTDENGHRQKSHFDAYGRLIKKEEYLGADGRSPNYPAIPYTMYASTLYLYDSEGNLLQTKDAYNNTTTITYDVLGRKMAMTDPDMGHWSYQYDLNGNLTKQTDAKGQTLTFTYDALNRLTNKTDGTALNVNYTYDNALATNSKGRLTQAAYPNGNTQFAYDELGRELKSVKEMNARAFEVGRDYDALNRLAAIQYPQGEQVVYHYNAAGQIETVANDPTLTPPVTLNAPELYLIQTGSAELKLSWGSVIDAAGYKIKYGTSSGNYTTTLDVGVALSKVITGLTNDTTYYFVVLAYNPGTQSGNSNERPATPAAPAVITMPSPWVQYAFNDNAANTNVADTSGALYPAITEQTSLYTSDLTGSGTASASSYLTWGCDTGACPPGKAFDDDYYNWGGWVAEGTKSGWLAYEFSKAHKVNRYVIWPRGHIYPNDDGNPRTWTFEGLNGSGWDVLDTRSYSSWSWQSPVTFNFTNDTAYQKYRLNISSNGNHVEVGITEMEMMAFAPLFTNALASGGKINNAFQFNGGSQLVNADSLLAAKNHVVGSIALWVRPDAPSYGDTIFSLNDTDGPNRVELRASPDAEFSIINSTLTLRVGLPQALAAGVWSHIVLVQDGQGVKGYVSGREVAVTVWEQSLGVDAWFNSTWGLDNARIGCKNSNNDGNFYHFAGQVDDFRYYSHPLSAAEVKALYNVGSGTEAKNPQYTEYTPLSKLQSGNEWWEAKNEQLAYSVSSISYFVSRGRDTVAATDNEIQVTNDGMRDTRYEIRATKAFFSSVGEWLERNILGVGEAEAQAALTDSFKQETSSNGLVSLEAENYHGNVIPPGGSSKWDRVTTTSQSGTGSMKANPNSGVSNDTTYVTASPRLDYKVKFVKTGTHYIWVRAIGATVNDDSLHVGLDGQALATSDKITNFTTSWTWSKTTADAGAAATISVATAGEHTLNLWMHKDGIVIDKIVVTSSATYTPSGTGPAESPQVVPAAPVLNTAVAGTGQVTLSWGAVSGAKGYKVVRGLVSKSYGTTATDTGPAKTYTVKNLTNGTKYYFAMFAYNAAGQSVHSNELSATPVAAPVLSTVTSGDKQVTLSWTAAAGAVGYKVYYGTTPAVYGTPVSVGNTMTATVTGLTNGATYYFAVSGINTSGESSRSSEMSAIPAGLLTAPVLGVPAAGNSQVSLSWSAVTGATGYRVYYGTAAGQYGVTPVNAGDVTSATVTGLTSGTVYYFVVTAYNVSAESARSNERSVAPAAPAPVAPVLNTATAGNGRVDLAWSTVSGVDGYKVQYGTASGYYTTVLDAGNVIHDTVFGLTNSTAYYFVVTAYNASGESVNSNELSATPSAPSLNGPVGYWKFDEVSGTAALDSSGSGYTGTLVNMEETDHVAGKMAGALDLDGSNEYVNIGSPAGWNISNAITVAAWVKIDTDKHGRIITKHGGSGDYGFMLARYLNNDSLEWRISTTGNNWLGGVTSANSFKVGQWYHFTATYDGSVMRVYVDGQENTGGSFPLSASGNIRNSTASLRIGRDGLNYFFDGLIDEVRVYDRALSSSEIVDLFQESGSLLSSPVLIDTVSGNGQVGLTWSAAAGATGYNVYYGTAAGQYGATPVNAGDVTSATVTGLTNGTVYYFTVTAHNAAGQSVYSNELSATPAASPPPAPVLNSAAPGDGQVDLSWSAVTGATGYKVYYGTAAGQYGVTPVNAGDVTSATVTGLTNGTVYYFVVTAYNVSAESARSNERGATPVVPAPAAPVLNTATAGDKDVTLIWGAVTGAAGYKVYYGTSPAVYGTPIDAGNVTTKAVTGLTNGTTYYFTVSAVNAGGESVKSNEVNATPAAPVVIESPTLYIKNVDYNAAGQTTKVEYGNGDVTTYTYNPLNLRLTRLYTVNSLGQPVQDLNYAYDSAGNILSIDDKVNTADQTFKYDELNRLVEAANPNPGSYGTKSYTYDQIGNIVEKDGKTYFYGGTSGGPHAVTALSDGTTFTYDANGNMVTKVESGVTTAYMYDAENRLTKVVKNGSTIGQYEYDGDGGRTKKTATVGSTTTTTTYVGSLFETSGSRNTKFIFLGGQRVAAVTNSPSIGSTTLYYHADHLGGANVLTDATGFKKELIEYEPFGQESRHEKYGSSEEIAWYYFTGKPKDDETGLIYFGARYYDPKLGRFITPDSIVQDPYDPQTLNRYSYTSNNPINRVDPTGHKWSWKKFWNSFAGAVVGATVTVLTGGLGAPIAFALGGMVGGAITGGLEGGLQGALMGGLMGGVFGGAVGAGIGAFGAGFGYAALAAGGGYAIGTGHADSFVGGLAGGIVGSQIGNGIQSYYQDGISVQLPDGQTSPYDTKNWDILGIGTTDAKASAFANKNGSAAFYTKSRGLLADFVRAGMQKVAGNSLASRQFSGYLRGADGFYIAMHSEGTLTLAGAIKVLSVDGVKLPNTTFDFNGPVVMRSTASNLVRMVGGSLAPSGYNLNPGDPIGIFTTPNPVMIGIYGAIGVTTLGTFHSTKYYPHMNGGR